MQVSQKTLHDLELIRSDSELFGILWRRIQTVAPMELLEDEKTITENAGAEMTMTTTTPKPKSKIIPASTVVLYKVKEKD